MARSLRIEYEGAVYHVMSRGVKGAAIFRDRKDYELFNIYMEETCRRTGWRVHAYAQLPNHWHGLIETPEANLVEGMRRLQGAWAAGFNRRHGERGHVFQGRYKALIVDPDAGSYFATVSSYIHLNPLRAGLIKETRNGLENYAWSSYPFYLQARQKRPTWLQVERVLGDLGLPDDARGRLAFKQHVKGQAQHWKSRRGRAALDAEWKHIRRDWCLGDVDFKQRMLLQAGDLIQDAERASYNGPAVRKHNQAEAEALLRAGMGCVGLNAGELNILPKADVRKCAVAWLVHSRTTARHRWLAEQLYMGCPSNMTRYINGIRDAREKRIVRLRERLERL
ncbi:MAG: transposase [Lentisphaerae bacterium]|nr:transposase [Lentisphaerota bacterium]